MTRRRLPVFAAAAFVVSLMTSASLAWQDVLPRFRASADLVAVDVAVHLRGRPVTGLSAADFELFDNGGPQPIVQVGYETLPIDVTVAFDASRSVSGSVLEDLRRSVRELTTDLLARDRLRLLTFNSRVSLLADFAGAPATVDEAFAHLVPWGNTAFFDALAVALATPAAPDRRQLVVAFSDGSDTASITTEVALLDVARHTTPTLVLVLASAKVPPAYERLVKETGGFAAVVERGRSLGSTFRKALVEFRQSYILYFRPGSAGGAGLHALEVRVKRPGVDIRARKNYVAR